MSASIARSRESMDESAYSTIISNSIPVSGMVAPRSNISVSDSRESHPILVNHDLSDGEGEYDEGDDLLSEVTSDTTFFDDESSRATYTSTSSHGNQPTGLLNHHQTSSSHHNASSSSPNDMMKENWTFTLYRIEGKSLIIGEWVAKTKSYRYVVIGPDWPCVMITYIFIIIPSIFAYLYIVDNIIEEVLFFLLFGIALFGLTTVVFMDPGLVRKYHHARSRHWTYCDHCESFRPPQTVHCSTCQVCIGGYDHHCPWTGKCIGHGNIIYFKIFVISLAWLAVYVILLGILAAVHVA